MSALRRKSLHLRQYIFLVVRFLHVRFVARCKPYDIEVFAVEILTEDEMKRLEPEIIKEE